MIKDIKKYANGNENPSKRRNSQSLSGASTSKNDVREKWFSSTMIDLKQLKGDMEFQIDALLHMNKVIDSEISNLNKKIKSRPKASNTTVHTQRHKTRPPRPSRGGKRVASSQKRMVRGNDNQLGVLRMPGAQQH